MEIIRSATFEGMADTYGFPTTEYISLYENLAKNGVKTIITGFMFISNQGRAMHPGQAGMDNAEKIPAFQEVTEAVHKYGAKIIAQLAHTGRQTTNTGYEIVGVSDKKSFYFNEVPKPLTTNEIYEIADQFANSASYAQQAGFDGVQLHAAHGYLIHQFLLKSINNRADEFRDGELFLKLIVNRIREKCGDFPIWVKVSGDIDIEKYTNRQFTNFIKFLDLLRVDAIEISYGTMDYALNIFRGGVPLKAVFNNNPIYQSKNILWKMFCLPFLRLQIKPFTPMYNVKFVNIAKKYTNIPIAVVGGFRRGKEILNCEADYVSLCRPFICEPDFIKKLNNDEYYKSKCTNCNLCAVMVDSEYPLKCYGGK